jgi:hypothetical protein
LGGLQLEDLVGAGVPGDCDISTVRSHRQVGTSVDPGDETLGGRSHVSPTADSRSLEQDDDVTVCVGRDSTERNRGSVGDTRRTRLGREGCGGCGDGVSRSEVGDELLAGSKDCGTTGSQANKSRLDDCSVPMSDSSSSSD